MSESTTEERTKRTPEERSLHRHLAKALWKVQKKNEIPKEASERQKMWEGDKKGMIDQARRVVHQLQRSGITMTAPAVQDESAKEPAA